MKRISLLLFYLFCLVISMMARKTVVWENPVFDFSSRNNTIELVNITFSPVETTMKIKGENYGWVRYDKACYLLVDSVRYTATSSDGLPLGEKIKYNGDYEIVLHFPALRKVPQKLSFFEGDGKGAFQFKNIRPRETAEKNVMPSVWRNVETGNYEIAFMPECVMYDGRYWDYKSKDETKDKYTFVLINGKDELTVELDNMKEHTRMIRIGDRQIKCEPLLSRKLPDYPTKDLTPLKDNGYSMGDSATIIGWYRNFDKKAKKEVECGIRNIFTARFDKYTAKTDSLGRFILRVPVQNTTRILLSTNHDYKATFIEPGETYFLLYDRNGWKMFIGNNCRLQNESFSNTLHYVDFGGAEDKVSLEDYQKQCDRKEQECKDLVNKTYAEHPNLSERYKQCVAASMYDARVLVLNESLFHAKGATERNKVMEEIMKECLNPTCKPFTLMDFYPQFVNNLVFDIAKGRTGYIPMSYVVEKCQLPTTKKQQEHISKMDNAMAIFENEIGELTSRNQLDSVKRAYNRICKPIMEDSTALPKEYVTTYTEKCRGMYYIDRIKGTLSHYNVDPVVREMFFSNEIYKDMDLERKSMPEMVLNNIDSVLTMPAAKAEIMATHNKYYTIEHQNIDGHPSLKSNDIVNGITDGEALLSKITEPYRGRYILLDVWGSWCAPCKEGLSKSKEEYERLAPYNIVYLYLASTSPENAWKNVIKQYNVLGDNVVHYNLPGDKQQSIEKYLKLTGYPTYRLIHPDGKTIDELRFPLNLDEVEAKVKK